MKIDPQFGDLQVKAGEEITVTVEAIGTAYLAAFSDIPSGDWTIVSPPNPEIRKFKAPNVPVNHLVITFGFDPQNDPNAKYHVTIVGDPAEDTSEKDVPCIPPFPADRNYRFVLK